LSGGSGGWGAGFSEGRHENRSFQKSPEAVTEGKKVHQPDGEAAREGGRLPVGREKRRHALKKKVIFGAACPHFAIFVELLARKEKGGQLKPFRKGEKKEGGGRPRLKVGGEKKGGFTSILRGEEICLPLESKRTNGAVLKEEGKKRKRRLGEKKKTSRGSSVQKKKSARSREKRKRAEKKPLAPFQGRKKKILVPTEKPALALGKKKESS